MFSLLITTLLVSLVWANTYRGKIDLQSVVDDVNSNPKSTWKADNYGIDELSYEEWRDKLGAKLRKPEKSSGFGAIKDLFTNSKRHRHRLGSKTKLGGSTFLPVTYDTRHAYAGCASIGHIRDQSACGSCWAVSAASAFSDRLCIFSDGAYNFELSSRFLLSCDRKNYGCGGGYLDRAWEFLQTNGTVTGNEYQSDRGCQPYPLWPCGYSRKLPCPSSYGFLTPKCVKTKCDNELYKLAHEKNTFKVQKWYAIGDPYFDFFNEYLIKKEIYYNGPVQVGFDVYADFFAYKSGIYEHDIELDREFLGGHAVKLIGWGVEKGVKYWIGANSWGEEWGEKGTFRIVRGKNNCGIENEAYAGIPQVIGGLL